VRGVQLWRQSSSDLRDVEVIISSKPEIFCKLIYNDCVLMSFNFEYLFDTHICIFNYDGDVSFLIYNH
jgi:hypothetical protein